ncbi:Metal-dependent hydrolase, endonuclease/exonuclease/phosphatase family [Paenibacillus sp. UNC496MF]|uniref:endonuclease/exonuclease/phosphatase family protein n=1 Tax=Paenibacillus sp. UNC496MF TaxID=1502753 RepID=UPI0008E973F1|nr:endonuclease/exonuclease/phosphatase family protein [Paenibacillus sp. UNC496MF]SFI50449.1 Metal-dependent hydrolase, endonuclease/exonuclease/phosphatase family [Paenibacillus sp. UNC496MF]
MAWTVMTFNLRNSSANDGDNAWPNRIGAAAATIRAHAPSLFGIQEGFLHMLEELNALLPDYAWIGEGRGGGTEDEHCAIFYRKADFDLLEQGQFWLSETPEQAGSVGWDSSLPRICTWGRFRAAGSPEREIAVYNTHLDHIGEQAREQGMRLVLRSMAREGQDRPAILMGDFNAEPGDRVIRFLRGQTDIDGDRSELTDAYAALEASPGRTFHDFRGGTEGEPIDYLFVNAPLTVSAVQVDRGDIDGRYPSDHYPVIARIAPRA